ncbi:hypothetical protein Trydic_g1249 [Trypoxylus dichotomus]
MSTNLVPKLQWWREEYELHSEMLLLVIEQHRSDNEALKPVLEANSSTTCIVLAVRFYVSADAVRLHLHQLTKTWKLDRCILHELPSDN